MMLMMAVNELNPMFGSLAPVIALTHALWDGWMPQATMAKSAVKGPAAVATLKRMYWTTLEHDPFLWCMHDGRIVDPTRPHSMHKCPRAGQLTLGRC